MDNYTTYPNGFIVVDPTGVYSKHYYMGSQLIASRVGDTYTFTAQAKSAETSAMADLKTKQQKDLLYYATLAGHKEVDYKEYKASSLSDIAAEDNNTKSATAAATISIYYYHPDHLGTNTLLTDMSGNAYQLFLNLPFGESMAEQSSTGYYQSPYKFNGKELDKETGLYYYGARYYDAKASVWLSVDPMAGKFPGLSPYNYCVGNPVTFIDVNGLYPKSILVYDNQTNSYHLTSSAIHLMSLTTGVSKDLLGSVIIQERAAGRYRPWYNANKGGGAITIGNTITFTENFFDDDSRSHKGNGYGLKTWEWLDLLSHEVGHLPQVEKEGNTLSYLAEFAVQYAESGNHNDAKYENEAENRKSWFTGFEDFTNKYFGDGSLIKLMDSRKSSQDQKIQKLDVWNNAYKSYIKLVSEGKNPAKIDLNEILQNVDK